MVQLTKMQQRIYDYIAQTIRTQGYPPSVREIGDAVGLKSPSTVHFHLKHMEELGVIGKGAGKGRALTLTEPLPEENQIPIVGTVAAGTPILAEECIEDYLTFDAGYENGCTPAILEALKKHHVPATFFVVGNWADQYPEQAKAIVDSGCELMNHSILEMSRNVQSGNTQNLKSMVIQRSFPKWSVAERRKTAAASNQAACCACTHSRYLAGGSPSGLRV